MSENNKQVITVIISDERYTPPPNISDSTLYIHWTREITSSTKVLKDKQLLKVCAFIIRGFIKYYENIDKEKLVNRLKAILNETGDEQIDNDDDDDYDDNDDDLSWEDVKAQAGSINAQFKEQIIKIDSPRAMFLVVNDDIDPIGTLRQWLRDSKDCGITLHPEDCFPLPTNAVICTKESIDSHKHTCYYEPQLAAADIILKRIKFILKKEHGKLLSDFSEFDFRIYTANSLMLEEQTKNRLRERDAECLNPSDYDNEENLKRVIDSKVFKYVTSKNSTDDLAQLQDEAKQNPYKLYLVVADEAHWGVSCGDSANKRYIDDWNNEEYPNVFVLQVTATPWTLLTKNSKLDCETFVADDREDRLIVVEENRNRLFTKKETSPNEPAVVVNVTDIVGVKKLLHIIKWNETYESRLSSPKGFLVYIRIPQTVDTDPLWLTIGESASDTGLYPWMGVADKTQATPVMFKGRQGKVTISCEIGEPKKKKVPTATLR